VTLEAGAGEPGLFKREGIALAGMGRIDDGACDAFACCALVANASALAAALDDFRPGAVEGMA
jgi:hypothetical protein